MSKKLILIVAFALAALITMATPLLAQEVYVVWADNLGHSNYALCNPDGTFGNEQYIGQIPQPYVSYGNGIGDFDNDGDYDYIIGTGNYTSYAHEIYLYEKLGSGNDFAAPVLVGTWTEGGRPMDMAVADYNNDGNMDFVLTHYGSANSELYLGNGDFTFTRSILYSTAPINSYGADAADFNNDGNADFVASHYSNSNPNPPLDSKADTTTSHNPYYLYVNLGNGDGTFTTTSFVAGGRSWGVTAGDFDNDGIDDIIHDGTGGYDFYFYKGNGDGTFQAGTVLPELSGVVAYGLDNFDFDSDGNMDIVFGHYYNIRYYRGNGAGTFTFVSESARGTVDPYCLSAPSGIIPLVCRISVDVGPDVSRECDNPVVTLQGTAIDTCDDDPNLNYVWWEGTTMLGTGSGLTYDFDLGTHYVTLAVTNSHGTSGKDVVKVEIVDTTPPEITCPPNVTVIAYDFAEVCIVTDWPGNYSWEEIAFEWETDIGTPLGQIDDDYDYVALGFDFDFYGSLYSGIYIGSNGLIKFDAGSRDYSNSCLPSIEAAAQYMIAPLWDDLNPAQGGDVYYKYINVIGSSPLRKFVVTWLEVPHYYDYGSNTFQVILYEETGKIQFNYSHLWDGNTPTVGVQLNTSYYTSICCNTNPNWPSSILLSPPCSEYAMVEVAIDPDIGTVTAEDNCDPSVTITNDAPHIFRLGETVVTWTATDWEGNQSTCTQVVTVTVVPPFGSICASVNIAGDPPTPAQGVIVTVIDQNNDPVGDPLLTDGNGEAFFDPILVGEYSVMIVTPLGYIVSPSETQTNIAVVSNECTPVDFILTPTITTNDCRTIGYWKHQFNVYTSGRGNAQESSTDLEAYLGLVHVHFDVLGVYFGLENYEFVDAKDVLTIRGGRVMLDRAKQQLFALLMNFASGRIGNETVVSEDDRVAAEAVTYAAILINDGDPANDELAKTICDLINNGQTVEAGIIPESPERYKVAGHDGIPKEYVLNQNYPNPFNPVTQISYTLPRDGHVKLQIYNLLGQKVAIVVDEYQQAGQNTVNWEAKDLSSGIYFYKLSAGDFTATKKMVLTK